jgi:ferredoxin-NADP reductase
LLISKKEQLTHDTIIIELEFQNKEWISGLWVGGHIVFHAQINGRTVSRKYTPISPINEKGKVTFAIKIYKPCPEFPQGGVMSKWLDERKVGDIIFVEGPIGKLKYHGYGNFDKSRKRLPKKENVGLIAAGSGITPMLAIAQASSLAKDGLKIKFLYCNKTMDDIMCQQQLEDLSHSNADFAITHTLTRHVDDKHGMWTGLKGRPTIEMLQECDFPPPGESTLIAICGPLGFN